jgi:hypothetical protein
LVRTSIPENPNARGLAEEEEEEEDSLSSIVHFVLCIRHLFTWAEIASKGPVFRDLHS